MTKLFLIYGRKDAAGLADRLRVDLEKLSYEFWQDTREIRAGREWEDQIVDWLRGTQVVIALLSHHALRRAADSNNADCLDSVCLDELIAACFVNRTKKPIIKSHRRNSLGKSLWKETAERDCSCRRAHCHHHWR